MKKKICLAFLIGVILSLLAISAHAAYIGTVRYGGFEEAGVEGVCPTGWNLYDSPWRDGFATSADYAKEGVFSLKTTIEKSLENDTGRARLTSATSWGYFDTSAQYELSVWVLIPEGSTTTGAYLLPRFYKGDGSTYYVYTAGKDKVVGDTNGQWVKTKVVFTTQKSFGALESVFLRCDPGTRGVIYWDDMQLHKLNADGTYADAVPERTFDEATSIFKNGDFSELSSNGKKASYWNASNTWGSGTFVEKNGDGEKNAVKITGTGSPYIYQVVEAVGGTKLTLHLRYKTVDAKGNPVVKFSYRNNGQTIKEFTTESLTHSCGKWTEFIYDFTMPDGATSVLIYLRKYGASDVYYSSASLYKNGESPLLTISTERDATFYYSDWESGTAHVTLNTEATGKKVTFYLWDGKTKKSTVTKTAEATMSFTFPISQMEKKTAHTICAELKDSSGKILDTAERTVYRFDRPSALSKNGQFTQNGETITPVISYHVYTSGLMAAKAAGINVIQGGGSLESEGSIGAFLDTCWYEYGIRAMIPLYTGNMLPAGHYVNRERTETIINMYKDHPGLFGYMVQDEPFLQNRNNPEEVKAQLVESYRLIRTLDDAHPVYMTADIYSKEHYVDIGNCCDVIAPDDYAIGAGRALTSVYDNISNVNAAVQGEKPVYTLLQIFAYSGGRQPTIDELRHMTYQSLLAGADAIGFYSFEESNGWKFVDTPLYGELSEFVNNELPALYKAMQTEGKYTETKANDILLRQYADGTCIGLNFSDVKKTHTAVLPKAFSVSYGEGAVKASGSGALVELPSYGRMLGDETLKAFDDVLQITGTKVLQAKIVPNGKKIIPDGSKLFMTVYKNYGGKWEMTTLDIGEREAAVSVPESGTYKIAVMILAPSGGNPIYLKEIISSKDN